MFSIQRRALTLILMLPIALFAACADDGDDGQDGATGPTGPAGPPGSDGGTPVTSVEGCEGCHGAGQISPVADITLVNDVHAIDTDVNGPLTPSGYRRIDITISQVDVGGSSVVIDFTALDETLAGVDDLLPGDGRFALGRIDPSVAGDPSEIVNVLSSGSTERFTSGTFDNLTGGAYRYTSAYDPTGLVANGDSLRLAIQVSASDIPAENAWCDFDADLLTPPNDCVSGTTFTRDIVQTADCNVCHGPTSDTKLSFHGGGRTDVEYCISCHNPQGNTDFPLMIHKIHAGSYLENGFSRYSDVEFTKELDDCAVCHTGGGADVDNWKTVPNIVACGSCHDDVDFENGINHGRFTDNAFCTNCHPPDGPITPGLLPVATVHQGAARNLDAATYRPPPNGYAIEAISYDEASSEIDVRYSVTKNNSRMTLETAPEWTNGGSLALRVAWDTSDYTNTGSGSTPAQPVQVNALDVGGAVTALGGGLYQALIPKPAKAFGTVAVLMDGRPVTDLDGDGTLGDRTPVRSAVAFVDVEGGRSSTVDRRQIVDSATCNTCHDSGGAGLSIHGGNRVGDMQVCSLCHNADATDINVRPADPTTTPDMKAEESIDFKRMIHQIHTGADLAEGYVVYGRGSSIHDYSTVNFIANSKNCETCHLPGTYSTEAGRATLPSTIDTGADEAVPTDDLNISPTAAVCSSCHDNAPAKDHMKLYGASFEALDADIQ